MAWGRLALIEAAKERDDEILSKVAQLHSYSLVNIEKGTTHSSKSVPKGQGESGATTADETPERDARPPARFVYVKNMQQLDPATQQDHDYLNDPSQQLQEQSDHSGTYQFDPPRPLLSSAQLIPFLHNNITLKKTGKKINQTLLGRDLAQGKAIEKLPVKAIKRWPARLEIVVDTGDHLRPYMKDFERIVADITSILGKDSVHAYRMEVTTRRTQQFKRIAWPAEDKAVWRTWALLSSDTPVLILSDFGVTDKLGNSDVFWWRFAKLLKNHSAPIITLSPALTSPKCHQTCNIASVTPLRDAISLPRHAPLDGFRQQGLSNDLIKAILVLLSPLPIVDVGLLRKLRDAFDWGPSYVEGQLWNHPEVEISHLGMRIKPFFAKQYAKLFDQGVLLSNAEKLWSIVHKHHENAFQGLKQLENINHALTQSIDSTQTKNYIRQLCATTKQSLKGSGKHSALQAQCRTYLASQPDDIWVSELGDLFYDLCAMAFESEIKEGKPLPISGFHFQPERLKWLLDPREQMDYEPWKVVQVASDGALRFELSKVSSDTGFPVHHFSSLRKAPTTVNVSDGLRVPIVSGLTFLLDGDKSAVVTLEKHRFELATMQKPKWAISIESRDGVLQASFLWSDHTIKCFWRFINGIGEWTVENPFGFDQYGLYTDFPITPKITQRFRWIEPGTFSMGSPEAEPERSEYEDQHEVTLLNGYWLADTTVTQGQWQTIIGENPSHFKGDNLPVENVSWDDSHHFIQQLNKSHQSLTFQLPTEAQWEYACRAETTTAFSFGENITPEQVNYDGELPYNNGRKGEFRSKTVPVKSLPSNTWGLYEMHGNVWEWCQDNWQGNLGKSAVTDPKYEMPEEGAGRVVRGGSWGNYGRDARSAYRSSLSPDFRYGGLGLRLSLGQPSGSSRGDSRLQSQSRPAASSASRVAEQRPAGVGDGLLASAQRAFKGLFGGKSEK